MKILRQYNLVLSIAVFLGHVCWAESAVKSRNAYFGDLHVHTGLSPDAYIFSVRTTPDDAYRYAMGEAIEHVSGEKVQLKSGSLDFYAVTDHAEYMGVLPKLTDPNHPLAKTDFAQRIRSQDQQVKYAAFQQLIGNGLAENKPVQALLKPDITRSAWQDIQKAAEKYYRPGEFATFIGYEWTAMPDNQNLHRNVIFRGTDVPELPFSSFDSEQPEGLWAFLDKVRKKGSDVLAIPHNANLSNGLMFPRTVDSFGRAIDAAYAEQRLRNEPLQEITQIKGTSETHPLLSPADEFADFEIYEKLIGRDKKSIPGGSYIRDAYRRGLEIQSENGFNLYRFGVIGSSDTHNAGAPIDEDSYFGKVGVVDGTPRARQSRIKWGASGLAAVWAEENTREAIFDALQRKETFATTGPRIRVRFFGGWNYPENLHQDPECIDKAYTSGVPMGGELPPRAVNRETPAFVAWALKAPDGANLDRIQIIKGWSERGKSFEKIYDVALSDDRQIDPKTAKAPSVGSTVDVANPGYENSIGAAELSTTWTDPDFDPEVPAFYYARVIEIPTPRWSTFDAARLGVTPAGEVPVAIQERAYTSPVWYSPP